MHIFFQIPQKVAVLDKIINHYKFHEYRILKYYFHVNTTQNLICILFLYSPKLNYTVC